MRRIHILYFLLFSLILLPWIKIGSASPEIRPEWVLLIIGLLVFHVGKKTIKSSVAYWSIALAISFFVSTIYGMTFLNVSVDARDFFELLKPILYFLLYIFVASTSLSLIELKRFLKIAILIFSVAGAISVIQYFAPETIRPILSLFTDSERIIIYAQARATGTMGNANDLGMLNMLGFALTLYTIKHKLFGSGTSSVVMIIMALGVLASGSRTAFVCLLLVVIYFFYSEFNLSLKRVVALAVVFVTIYTVINLNLDVFQQSTKRYASINNLEEDVAWMSRLNGAIETLSLISRSIFFGYGPNKKEFLGSNIDNEYILILYRYGIIGIIVSGGYFFALWRQSQHTIRQSVPFLKSYSHFSTAILLASMAFAYTAGIYMSFRLMMLLVLFCTIVINIRYDNSDLNT